jgi:homogentisate 1,2-dioxygenase
LGKLPQKRHTVFQNEQGKYYYEQLFGTEGFSGMSSLLYHEFRPTMIKAYGEPLDLTPKAVVARNLMPRKLAGFQHQPTADFLQSRSVLFFNQDVQVGVAAPQQSVTEYFYKNADADEVLFIHEGTGTLKTMLGQIRFGYGDYLVIPRGMIYQIHFDTPENRIFFVESYSPVYFPKRYRNQFGQLLEHAPFCERDIRQPENLETHRQKGDFLLKIKKQGILHPVVYASHPFDVVGWDGYNYPYAFSIHDFEPITGRIHQPPPVHQTFEGKNFVICSFCPRLYDYHPQAVPAPYNHSNIDSEELLYYVDGDFMSRNNIARGHMTLHPGGIPHGPHPGAMERSIGKTQTEELAVMVDTFHPLMLTETALQLEIPDYHLSWLE